MPGNININNINYTAMGFIVATAICEVLKYRGTIQIGANELYQLRNLADDLTYMLGLMWVLAVAMGEWLGAMKQRIVNAIYEVVRSFLG